LFRNRCSGAARPRLRHSHLATQRGELTPTGWEKAADWPLDPCPSGGSPPMPRTSHSGAVRGSFSGQQPGGGSGGSLAPRDQDRNTGAPMGAVRLVPCADGLRASSSALLDSGAGLRSGRIWRSSLTALVQRDVRIDWLGRHAITLGRHPGDPGHAAPAGVGLPAGPWSRAKPASLARGMGLCP
jgi:hypothetical protein